jgi:hypothetical protein
VGEQSEPHQSSLPADVCGQPGSMGFPLVIASYIRSFEFCSPRSLLGGKMNEDVTQQPTVSKPSAIKTRKRSVMSFVTHGFSLLLIAYGCSFVFVCSIGVAIPGIKSASPFLVFFISFGLYPLIMGLVLRRQALKEDRNHHSGYLIFMLFGALIGWFGLMQFIYILDLTVMTTAENNQWLVLIMLILSGEVFVFIGCALFWFGLKAGRKAAVGLSICEPWDSTEATHTLLGEQGSREAVDPILLLEFSTAQFSRRREHERRCDS